MYRIPWQSARASRARTPVRGPQPPTARPQRATIDGPASREAASREAGQDLRAGTPDMRWPSLGKQAPRHIPVVGPTEALRGWADGPGADAPRGAVPGLLEHEQESGWQLAQRVWQASGVAWEADAPEPDYSQPDPYAAHQYSAAPNPGPYLAHSYLTDSDYPAADDYLDVDDYPEDDYPDDDGYRDGDFPADHDDYRAIAGHQAYGDADDLDQYGDLSPAHQYSAAPYPAGRHLADRHATRPDLPVLPDPAESPRGVGPWPVQQPAAAPRPATRRPTARMAWQEPRSPGGRGAAGPPNGDRAPRASDERGRVPDTGRDQQSAQRPTDNPAAAQAPGLARTPAAMRALGSAQAPVSAQAPASAHGPVSAQARVSAQDMISARGPVPARDSLSGQTPASAPEPASAYGPVPAQDSVAGPAPVPAHAPASAYGAVPAQGPAATEAPQSTQAPFSARGPVPGQAPGWGPVRTGAPDHGADGAAPPLPRRIRQAGAGWNERPSAGLASQAWAEDGGQPAPPRVRAYARSSEFAPPSPFASRQSLGAASAPGSTRPMAAPLSAPVAPAAPPLGESDELFRAWQGSVREAAGGGTPWSAPRRRPRRGVGVRGIGWQVAKIGVPAAVIVTVGAGALLMLTGRANEMLAERSNTGVQPSGQPGITAASGQPGAATAGLILAGYPGQRGPVGVAAMWSAGGTTMAVGYADAHPAVWRHAPNGTWSLVSTAALGGLTGNLTAVAKETSGWIAVGSANENGTEEPVVFWSPDGVAWSPLPALTGIAGAGAQFLGVAAGPGGYLVVGKQGSGAKERAAFWWSADLKNWISATGTGAPANATAAAAVNNGFVAVGSMAGCHTIWLSADGQHWTEYDLAKPSGATSAMLNSVAVDQVGRLVAGGVAAGGAGDIPVVVSSADGGVHVTQVILSAPQGPASVTAVTATSGGFVAVGLAGSGKAQRAVEWTSRDGVTWSAATPVSSAGTSQITALTASGGTVTGTARRGTGPSVLALPAG